MTLLNLLQNITLLLIFTSVPISTPSKLLFIYKFNFNAPPRGSTVLSRVFLIQSSCITSAQRKLLNYAE